MIRLTALLFLLIHLTFNSTALAQLPEAKSKDGKISGLLGIHLGEFVDPVKHQIAKLKLVKDIKHTTPDLLVYSNVALDDHMASLVTFKIFRNKLVEIFVHFKTPRDTSLIALFDNLHGDVEHVFGKPSYDDRSYDSVEVHSVADEITALKEGKGHIESYWVTPNFDGDHFNSITLFVDDHMQICMRLREGKLYKDVQKENVKSLIEDF